MHQDESSYFWSARKILNTEERDNDAFVRLVAGISEADEPLFEGGAQQFFEARQGFGDYFSHMLAQDVPELRTQRAAQPAATPRKDPARFDADKFMMGFNSEIAQLQVLALMGERRPRERPVTANGLVAAADGLHWTTVSFCTDASPKRAPQRAGAARRPCGRRRAGSAPRLPKVA